MLWVSTGWGGVSAASGLLTASAAACSAAADAVNTDVQPRSETLKQDEKLHLSVRQRSLKIYSSEL